MALGGNTVSDLVAVLGQSAASDLINNLGGAGGSSQTFTFYLAPGPPPGINLSAGTNLFGTVISRAAKTLSTYSIFLGTNPSGSGGGATFDILKGGVSILSAPVTIAAGVTTVTTGTPATRSVASGDEFTVNTSSVGTGVQDVKVSVY